MGAAERAKRWRGRHPEKSRSTSAKWRQRHPAEWAFLDRRNQKARTLMVQWVRTHRPDVYAQCRQEAKRLVPVADLAIEEQMAYERKVNRESLLAGPGRLRGVGAYPSLSDRS